MEPAPFYRARIPRGTPLAKRGANFGAFLREQVVEPVGHAQWVFTILKTLRGYFMRNRELLGDRTRAAWETVRAMMGEGAGEPGLRPGMVVVPQTFGSSVNAHPHVHAIASRGGWTREGTLVPVPLPECRNSPPISEATSARTTLLSSKR
ncbi:MAG: transposase [Acidobacteria bacterium]|nr:transposase [Acidobacteriota bacterium]